MYSSQEWWSSGVTGNSGGGGGDAGDPIANSLRFRSGVSEMRRAGMTGGSKVYTVSYWIKHGNSTGKHGYGIGSETGQKEDVFGVTPDRSGAGENCPYIMGSGVDRGLVNFTDQFRDYSAWYHYHFTYDVNKTGADRVHCFVNGRELTNRSANSTVTLNKLFQNTQTSIGNSWYQVADCYSAGIYVIDGQALPPTTFGRYNANNVWVPVDPKKDGDTAWYGANGFHLSFDPTQDPDPMVAIGMDSSGNDNHFTAEGFDISPPGIWSAGGDNTNAQNPYTWVFAFNGAVGQVEDGAVPNANTTMTWAGTIPANGKQVRVNYATGASMNGGQITINSTDVNPVQNRTNEWVDLGVFDADITSISISRGSVTTSGATSLCAIEVDGVILVDSTGATYDLMLDSPTQNWATFNPIAPGGEGSTVFAQFNNANLQTTTEQTGLPIGFTSIRLPLDKKIYCEFTATGNAVGTGSVGVTYNPVGSTSAGERGWTKPNTVTWHSSGSNPSFIWINEVQETAAPERWAFAVGTTSSIAVDTTLTPPQITFRSADANPVTVTVPADNDSDYYYLFSLHGGLSSCAWNLGQKPFLYTPPDGFEALQTQNLPAATIPDGRKHFQAITSQSVSYSGDVTSSTGSWLNNVWTPDRSFNGVYGASAISGPNYSQTSTTGGTFIWEPTPPIPINTSIEVNCFPQGKTQTFELTVDGVTTTVGPILIQGTGDEWYSIFTQAGNLERLTCTGYYGGSIMAFRVDGKVLVDTPILEGAQSIFPNGLWWIKDRVNSNNHQLLDTNRGDQALISNSSAIHSAYAAPAGESIAWCWSAPDEMSDATKTSGTINLVEGRTNLTAGFSMGTYVGTATNGTIAHGLSQAPDFKIIKNFSGSTSSWRVWCRGMGNDDVLLLDTNGAKQTATNYWNGSTHNNANFIELGTNAGVNGTGRDMAFWAWHAIPGYSAFGTYTGNGTADGVFLYLGFRPAFLMVKNDSTGGTGSNWMIYDTTRGIHNPITHHLDPNLTDKEIANNELDLLSNGVKFRKGTAGSNASGNLYIYAAFAEHPFQSPATAR